MQIIVFDTAVRFQLLPFTHTRPVADIRCGILTMRERWERIFNNTTSTLTETYLQPLYAFIEAAHYIYVNAAVFGTPHLHQAISGLELDSTLWSNNQLIAFRSNRTFSDSEQLLEAARKSKRIEYAGTVLSINNIWDIFSLNEKAIGIDFEILTAGRKSAGIPDHVTTIHTDRIFVEEGAQLAPCIINAGTGYVYIGKDAEIMEGVLIRGPLALCDHAVLKMGAKIYGATTIGPGCKVGGEVGNTVFFANSNKGHEGYIGNAVIGEWCNLGADTNCSNLKNNYDEVKVWNEYENKSVKTGLQFCGLLMGDHSKCGINTMFNTGTVVGVSCNVYGSGFLNKFIPSFSWGDNSELVTYKLEKAMDTANRMMTRRGKSLSQAEEYIFRYIFEQTEKQRNLLGTSPKD